MDMFKIETLAEILDASPGQVRQAIEDCGVSLDEVHSFHSHSRIGLDELLAFHERLRNIIIADMNRVDPLDIPSGVEGWRKAVSEPRSLDSAF